MKAEVSPLIVITANNTRANSSEAVNDPVTAAKTKANTRSNSRSPPIAHDWADIDNFNNHATQSVSRSSSSSVISLPSPPSPSPPPTSEGGSNKKQNDGSALVKFIIEQFDIDVSPLESGFRRRDLAGDAFVGSCSREMTAQEARQVLKKIRERPHQEVDNTQLLKEYRKAHRACVKLSLQMTDKLKSLYRVSLETLLTF